MNWRVPRRWRWRISLLAVLLGLSVFTYKAEAAVSPQARVHAALTVIAGRPFELNCTYAARGGGEAVAYPDGKPVVYVRPRWCGQARSFVRQPTVSAAKALLVLTHEALHLRVWAGARDELMVECLAVVEVRRLAVLIGGAGIADEVAAVALIAHSESGWPECPS